MPLKLNRERREIPPQVSVRLTPENKTMLTRALQDHPILAQIVNAAVTDYLTRHGYARKRETTS